MRLVRGLHNIKPEHRGGVLTIGNFDGVHLGHQAIIRQLQASAGALDCASMAMIFEPQPLEYFSTRPPARLTQLRDKVRRLMAQGVDRICCVQFNDSLRGLSGEQFIRQILIEQLAIRKLIVGDDFRFGCDRAGDFSLLQRFGADYGFTVERTDSYLLDEVRVSSTRVRQLLSLGDLTGAARLLGEPYRISGRVRHGQKLGRQLGVPTANLALKGCALALSGVFAVTVTHAGTAYQGVANVGLRPTVDGLTPSLEVHLFDVAMDLYGQHLDIEFVHRLRDEEKFANIEQLKRQILADVEAARAYFAP